MIIRVAEIPDEGLQIEGLDAFPQPFHDPAWRLDDLSLTVEKDGDAVFVRGRLGARVPQHCGRCLEPHTVTVRAQVDARFVPSRRERGEEFELGADDLETDVYDKGVIDLNTLVETETTLLLPMKPLCREDCRGLCPNCGIDWNTAACACAEKAVDPRLEVLRNFK